MTNKIMRARLLLLHTATFVGVMMSRIILILSCLVFSQPVPTYPAQAALNVLDDAERGNVPLERMPDQNSTGQLAAAARALRAGVVLIGEPGIGHGTGFIISRKNRLIVTNVHVADLAQKTKHLTVIRNDTKETYQVVRIYNHPGVLRNFDQKDKTHAIRSMDPKDGAVDPLSPDVAVLQLADTGPGVPVELQIASWDEIVDLLGMEIGMIGYPGYDTGWPEPGHKPVVRPISK